MPPRPDRALLALLLPPRLGRDVRRLVASSWATNLGDGVALAAGPLLVTRLTDSALLVAAAALVQWLPPMLLSLWAGAVTDRLDRRRLVVTVDAGRAVVLLLLAGAVATGVATVGLVLAALLLLACAEVFADNCAQTLLPMVVHRDDLAAGNARLAAGFVTANQLVGPPVGAALFAAGTALPILGQAVLVAAGAALAARLVLPPQRDPQQPPARLRTDVVEGLRWTWRHPAVRTLVVTITAFNVTFGAAWSVLVLYVTERLQAGPVGYGVVTATGAVGGLLGSAGYGALTRRVSLGDLLRVGLVLETLTHLALALTTSFPLALLVFGVFGAHAQVWNTTSQTVRQRAVPLRLQGRVGSVNAVGTYGGLALGAVVGGGLAQAYGVLAPFWFAFAGSAVFVVAIWRSLRQVAHADAAGAVPAATGDRRP